MCHMNVFRLMADDFFNVSMTDPSGNYSQECGSFIVAASSEYPSAPRVYENAWSLGWPPRPTLSLEFFLL